LIDKKCKIVICSHLGRPDGKADSKFSLKPAAKRLSQLLDKKVIFAHDCIGDGAYQIVKKAPEESIILLENLRFHSGEEQNDPKFAEQLKKASQARYFIQDGFGVVHRAHASTEAITHLLPSVAGLLLEQEVSTILKAMHDPERPFVAVLGGAKISDKLTLIERFVDHTDQILIGGAMANTFLQYYGLKIGKSIWEDGLEGEIRKIAGQVYAKEEKTIGGESRMNSCAHSGPKPCLLCSEFMVLPQDVAVGRSLDAHAHRASVGLDDVEENEFILDIGDKTAQYFASLLRGARTMIWNGTLGMAEHPAFAHGSSVIASQIHKLAGKVTSIIGGGDTAEYILKWNHDKVDGFSHISTGGGASLELMAGETLPGIAALLKDSSKR
jgi:phosphoglycerate kinase